MSGSRIFLDTNVLVYIYSNDEARKQSIAKAALANNQCVISTQVLTEFGNVAFKKLHLSAEEIIRTTDKLSRICSVSVVEIPTIQSAATIKEKSRYSFYDSLMIASALECQCDYLYSEDMSDGQKIGGVTIRNLFLYPIQ
jgi:predicted nucleic acid-binding protein